MLEEDLGKAESGKLKAESRMAKRSAKDRVIRLPRCPVAILFDKANAITYCQYNVSTTLRVRPNVRPRGSTRINLRIRPEIKAMLVQAARLQQMRLTEFMIKSSQAAAEMALADRTRFVLPAEKWREFNAALDSPPREIPALRKLFAGRAIFGRA